MNRFILLFISLLFSSCAEIYGMAGTVAVIDTASVAVTKKTADDHIVSKATDKDCSIERFINGKKYCIDKEEEKKPYKQPKTYCYKTLATVDCYTEPLKNQNDYLLNP